MERVFLLMVVRLDRLSSADRTLPGGEELVRKPKFVFWNMIERGIFFSRFYRIPLAGKKPMSDNHPMF